MGGRFKNMDRRRQAMMIILPSSGRIRNIYYVTSRQSQYRRGHKQVPGKNGDRRSLSQLLLTSLDG